MLRVCIEGLDVNCSTYNYVSTVSPKLIAIFTATLNEATIK